MSLPLDSTDPSRPGAAPPGSRRAAVVKRGAEREKRDLFAERDPDAPVSVSPPSSMRSSDAPPPSFGFTGGGVGARNESSVLFSVDQLALAKTQPAVAIPARAASSPSPSPASDGPRVADEEGVIDLKALSSRPPAAGPAAALASMRPQVAPLFSEPPPVTLEVEGGMRPNVKPTSRLAIAGIAVGSVAVLAAAIFGLSIAFRSEEPVKHTAAVVSPAPPPPPPVATPSAAPSGSVADNANAEPKDPPKGKRHGKGRRGAAVTGAATTPKAPKPSDPCGCHGDFNCVLACSAKGKM